MYSRHNRLAWLLTSLLMTVTVVGSSAQRLEDEVWSESGLRVTSKSLQLEVAADGRARIRLVAAGNQEIVVESQTFSMLGGPSGVAIKSIGPARVTAQPRQRTMEADSVELWLSPEGWGYLKAVRRVVRQ